MNASFDLVHAPWIPCVERDGRRVELGITETLSRAHNLVEVRDQSPLVTAALHRLLLAVLHRALDGPQNLRAWLSLWSRGRWDMSVIDSYLSKWRDRFDLFHPVHPFAQIGGFEIDKATPISKLAQELAAGSNYTVFDHSTDEEPAPVSPAEAARRLVGAQAFALGGGVGSISNRFGKHPNLTHAPMVGGATVFIRGASLFETLCLNLIVVDDDRPHPRTPDDRPTWEDEVPFEPRERVPRGYLDLLTWLARYVRLLPEPDRQGDVIVLKMFYTQGAKYPLDPVRCPIPQWAYRSSKDRGLVPVGLRSDRALWRDSAALFAAADRSAGIVRPHSLEQAARLLEDGHLERDQALVCSVVGMSNDQAKIDFWRHEDLPVSHRILRDEDCAHALSFGLNQAEEAERHALRPALNIFAGAFREAFQGVCKQATASFWSSLELPFRVFLAGIPDDRAAALSTWASEVRRVTLYAYRRAADNAEGRRARELGAGIRGDRTLRSGLRKVGLLEHQGGGARA